MTTRDALTSLLRQGQTVLNMFLADLNDADLLERPVPGANCPAWQLGHVIVTEARFVGTLTGDPYQLPAGFAEKHAKDTAAADPASVGFPAKAQYVDLFGKVRGALIAAVEKVPEAKFDEKVEGPMAALAPTVGALATLVGGHTLLHAGQFSVVRRKLGKPVAF